MYQMLIAAGVAQDVSEAHGSADGNDELLVGEGFEELADDSVGLAGERAQGEGGGQEHEADLDLAVDGDNTRGDDDEAESQLQLVMEHGVSRGDSEVQSLRGTDDFSHR